MIVLFFALILGASAGVRMSEGPVTECVAYNRGFDTHGAHDCYQKGLYTIPVSGEYKYSYDRKVKKKFFKAGARVKVDFIYNKNCFGRD